mmetsp:Transcript_56725/g.161045  ORF Transcript_56725/g.161045 Transcript_56725/m.161045 type:complete len:246 (+) Transcript_56725:77-814(+)
MADVESQEYQPMGTDRIMVKDATREVRMGFVRKVYGILSAQLLLTVLIAAPIQQMPTQWFKDNIWMMQASLIGSLCTMCALACCPDLGRRFPTNYLILFGFTVCEAVIVGMVSAKYSAGLVCACVGITALVFLGMTVYAFKTKSDFTGAAPYLFGGLLVLMTLGFGIGMLNICGVQTSSLRMLYAAGGVLMFTIFIVYDTQLILGEWGGHEQQFSIDDYVFASLNLYLDIINLFLHLLRLFGERR